MADHVADHEIRIDLVAGDDCLSRSDELIVQCLKSDLRIILKLRKRAALCPCEILVVHEAQTVRSAHLRLHDCDVDLVESEPVFYFILIPLHDRRRVAYEEVDNASVREAVIFCHDRPRDLIVAECYERLDPVLFALVKDSIIKCKSFLIRLRVVPVRENTRPVHGHTVALKSHLTEKRDIFLVVVIKIDRLMGWIESILLDRRAECTRRVHIAAEQHIRNGKPLSAFKICAFALICGCRAAPKKTVSEN